MLTKSDLASFRQCPRKVWLEHNRPDLIPQGDATTWRRANDGNIVGAKARELLGPNAIWPKGGDDPPAAATAAAAQLRANLGHPAVEFPMLRDGLYSRADALVPSPTGGYILRETKASTFPLKSDKITPDKPEEHHLDDLAIQAWVYQSSGWPLAGAELNLLDNRWRYPGNGDYSGLFRQLPVAAEIAGRVPEVPNWHAAAQAVLAGAMPDTQTGGHCTKPYDCQFHDHCKTLDAPGPDHPLAFLPGAGKRLAKKLSEQRGYTSILEPQPSEFTGTDAALDCRMQIAHRNGQPVLEPGSAAPFAALPYPRITLTLRASISRYRAGEVYARMSRSRSSGLATSNAPPASLSMSNSWISAATIRRYRASSACSRRSRRTARARSSSTSRPTKPWTQCHRRGLG